MEETIRWAVDALDSPMDRSLIADRLKETLQAAPSREPDARALAWPTREVVAREIRRAMEVLVLKKLVLVNWALAKQLRDPMAAREQKAMVQVLNEITLRAELDNSSPQDTPTASPQDDQPVSK